MSTELLFRPIRGASPFCGAAKKDGTTCRQTAGKRTNHVGIGNCWLHGGATPTHQAAASVAMARETAQLFAVPRDVHPIDGLLEEYARTAGMVDSYEAMCSGLLPDEVVGGMISEEISTTVDGGAEGSGSGGDEDALTPPQRKVKRGPGVNMWVKLYNEERDRFARLGVELLKLNLESRKVEYTQSQVAVMVAVLLSPDLALTDDQRRAAARLLRSMDGGASGDRPVIEGSVMA